MFESSYAVLKHSDIIQIYFVDEEIAIFTRQLCTERVPQFKVEKLLSNRLVPLKKQENGVRPVGVGETYDMSICHYKTDRR